MHTQEKSVSPDSPAPAKGFPVSYGSIMLLSLITAAGAFLRFHHIGYNSLWLDEGATYELSRFSLLHSWNSMRTGDFNPPLFFWMNQREMVKMTMERTLRFKSIENHPLQGTVE